MLTPTSTADTITTESDYVFVHYFKDSYQGIMAAKFLSENGYTKTCSSLLRRRYLFQGLRDSFIAAASEITESKLL